MESNRAFVVKAILWSIAGLGAAVAALPEPVPQDHHWRGDRSPCFLGGKAAAQER